MASSISLRQFLECKNINPATGLHSHFVSADLAGGLRALMHLGDPIIFQSRDENYAVLVREGDGVQHYWFNFAGDKNWRKGARFGTDVRCAPVAFINSTNGHYEVVVREGDHLQYYWFDYGGANIWRKGDDAFGSNVLSAPAAFQNLVSTNFEVVVREGDHLQHYYYDAPALRRWNAFAQFGADVQSAPAAFQNWTDNNFEVVVREGDHLRHYSLSLQDKIWKEVQAFGSNVSSEPVMFQDFNGNYQLFVREGSGLRHYEFKLTGNKRWRQDLLFGEDVQSIAAMFENIRYPNFEIVVWEGNHLQHYWYDRAAGFLKRGDEFGSNIQGRPSMFPNRHIVRKEDVGGPLGPTRYIPSGNYELVVREGGDLRHWWFDLDGDKQWHQGALLLT